MRLFWALFRFGYFFLLNLIFFSIIYIKDWPKQLASLYPLLLTYLEYSPMEVILNKLLFLLSLMLGLLIQGPISMWLVTLPTWVTHMLIFYVCSCWSYANFRGMERLSHSLWLLFYMHLHSNNFLEMSKIIKHLNLCVIYSAIMCFRAM